MEVNYCYGCFKELEPGQKICPCCGYDNSVCQNQSLALKEGTILGGRYLVGKVLGQGGFGITYLGFHLINKTQAAIKEYFPQGMCSRYINSSNVAVTKSGTYEKGKAAFETEARMLALFKDNHSIATVNECFYENNTAYIIMDYEDGPSLADEISRLGRIPWRRVLSLTLPLMEALDRLHQDKVIHRDIKPDNIKIVRDKSGKNERLVLLDFGAARSFTSANLTGNYTMILTPGFAPYEQYLQHTHLGPYTDIYSLCATMYMAITGEKPPAATDRMLGDTELKPFSHFHLHVPAYVEHAVFHGMEKKYTDRPQTMNDLYREFSNAGIYSSALDLFSTGTRESLEKALNYFKQIPGYRNSKELAERCTNALSKIYDSERIDSEKERIYQAAINAMQKGTEEDLTYASHLFGEISGWKNADELEQNSLKKIKDIESERIYREASEKMAEGNVNGLTKALDLFSQIPGWRDVDDLAAECKKKLHDLRRKKNARVYSVFRSGFSRSVIHFDWQTYRDPVGESYHCSSNG